MLPKGFPIGRNVELEPPENWVEKRRKLEPDDQVADYQIHAGEAGHNHENGFAGTLVVVLLALGVFAVGPYEHDHKSNDKKDDESDLTG